jgi:hypothetical protein
MDLVANKKPGNDGVPKSKLKDGELREERRSRGRGDIIGWMLTLVVTCLVM